MVISSAIDYFVLRRAEEELEELDVDARANRGKECWEEGHLGMRHSDNLGLEDVSGSGDVGRSRQVLCEAGNMTDLANP
jgi:hypothetical protein